MASKPDGGGFDFETRADTEELRRKLWLKMAKKVVTEDKNIPLLAREGGEGRREGRGGEGGGGRREEGRGGVGEGRALLIRLCKV